LCNLFRAPSSTLGWLDGALLDGPVRLLRNLAPLVLVALLATACGSGSSSSPGAGGGTTTPAAGTTGATGSLELRPVYARYATGAPLGPQVPKDLLEAMSSQSCPMKPGELQGMVMECDSGRTVFLLKAPIVSGDVKEADVQQIGHQNLYFLRLTLDPTAAATLDRAAATMTGTELAFCFGGSVLTSVIIDSHFSARHLAITGNYNKAGAVKLAGEITGS
jgi:preprotein translocase subunit SecD